MNQGSTVVSYLIALKNYNRPIGNPVTQPEGEMMKKAVR